MVRVKNFRSIFAKSGHSNLVLVLVLVHLKVPIGNKTATKYPTSGQITIQQGPVFQRVERASHWINHDPLENSINLISLTHWILIYPVSSIEQLGIGKYYQTLLFFFIYSA